MEEMRSDDLRMAELILHISKKCANDPSFGATKLNKILYFSDFLAFGHSGKAITEGEYQHLDMGPAPKRLVPVRDCLIAKNELRIEPRVTSFGRKQNRTIALREPNLEVFSAEQISLVNDVIDSLSGCSATDVSELSHRQVGWKMTKNGETIPYNSIFVSDEPLTQAEIRFAQGMIESEMAAA